ncbi:MAG: CvpA family protein [Clostridia bacterium]|nr:CvpA family protein [Clostridia bacterium]
MKISLILDALILLIAGLTVFFAVRNGFVKTVQSTAVFILSIVITLLLRQPVASLLYKTQIPAKVEDSIVSVISGLLDTEAKEKEAVKEPADSSSGQEQEGPSFLQTALGALGIDAGQYRALIREKIDGTADGLREMLRASVVPKAVSVLIQVIAVVGLFIVSNLLLRLVFWLLRKVIESVGILRSANRVLGLVLGILLAVLRVLLFVTVVAALLNVSAISQLPVVSAFRIDETYLFRWIHSINPFNFIFG